ncbi:MAG: hypothetical protein AAF191_16280, partial [Verrucomicrobiota bacterium]
MSADHAETPVFAVPEDFQPNPERLTRLEKELKDHGVKYLFGTYVDVHGIPKGKVNPLKALAKMAAGSELFT